jgi:hypothetical protein
VAAIIMVIRGQETEVEGDLTLGGGERVISVGDQTISGIFQTAREQFAAGRFRDQILPIEIKSKKGTVVFDTDEHVRTDAKPDDMSKLRAVFHLD